MNTSVQKEEPCILTPPPKKKINKQNQTPLNKTKESKKKNHNSNKNFKNKLRWLRMKRIVIIFNSKRC